MTLTDVSFLRHFVAYFAKEAAFRITLNTDNLWNILLL